jgi:hypothetical protein
MKTPFVSAAGFLVRYHAQFVPQPDGNTAVEYSSAVAFNMRKCKKVRLSGHQLILEWDRLGSELYDREEAISFRSAADAQKAWEDFCNLK